MVTAAVILFFAVTDYIKIYCEVIFPQNQAYPERKNLSDLLKNPSEIVSVEDKTIEA